MCFKTLVFLLLPTLVSAHHSVTFVFDRDKEVEIEGVVTKFDYRSPHSYLYVEAKDSQGKTVEYEIESWSHSLLRRQDIHRDTFQKGAGIMVKGWEARKSAYSLFGLEMRMSTGEVYTPHENARKDNLPSEASLELHTSGLSGLWDHIGWFGGLEDPRPFPPPPLNVLGKKTMGEFDVKNLRVFDCKTPEIGHVIFSPYGMEITQNEDTIEIHHEYFDLRRTVYLDRSKKPEGPRSTHGFSVGWYEGDTLVVRTTHFLEEIVTESPTSEQRVITERYSLSLDSPRLNVVVINEDEKYFTGPWIRHKQFVRDPEFRLLPFDCVPELSIKTRQQME